MVWVGFCEWQVTQRFLTICMISSSLTLREAGAAKSRWSGMASSPRQARIRQVPIRPRNSGNACNDCRRSAEDNHEPWGTPALPAVANSRRRVLSKPTIMFSVGWLILEQLTEEFAHFELGGIECIPASRGCPIKAARRAAPPHLG